MRPIARRVVTAALLTAVAAAAAATPDGTPARILTIGSWRTHDAAAPNSGAEPWRAEDVAGFLALHPQAFMDTGIRDSYPPGNRHWVDKGREVDDVQRLVAGRGDDAQRRICVTERPDVLAKLFAENSCDPSQGGGGCDWEGDMDGAFGETETVVKQSGVASGGSAASLEVDGANWEAARWKHRLLVLRPGLPSEERRRIVGSGGEALRVEPGWTKPPAVGERYEIRGSFDPAWVKRTPRAVHDTTVRELWTTRRNVCGPPGAARPCRGPAEPLDPLNSANRRGWPEWLDRSALTSLATPTTVPVLYGTVFDADQPVARGIEWTDPFFRVSAVVVDVTDPAYRAWRIRYLMYKLQDYGIDPGEPACISLSYKPGFFAHYDEAVRGPSGDPCAVPGSGVYTGPAHVCRDGSAPGGPVVAGLYGPGVFEAAINAYIRELIAGLAEGGWPDVRIMTVERPSFTPAKWSILEEDVRRHPAVIGEWDHEIQPTLADLRRLPRTETPPPAPSEPPASEQPPAASDDRAPRGNDAAPRPGGRVESSRGSTGGIVEPPNANR